MTIARFLLDLWRSARRPEVFRRCATIAAVVGTVLTLVNQGDLLVAGHADPALWWKVPANYFVPFVVSNLGAMSLTGRAS